MLSWCMQSRRTSWKRQGDTINIVSTKTRHYFTSFDVRMLQKARRVNRTVRVILKRYGRDGSSIWKSSMLFYSADARGSSGNPDVFHQRRRDKELVKWEKSIYEALCGGWKKRKSLYSEMMVRKVLCRHRCRRWYHDMVALRQYEKFHGAYTRRMVSGELYNFNNNFRRVFI